MVNALTIKKIASSRKRIAIALAGFATTAVVGAAGIAAAAPADKPSKAWCAEHGFTNYGQCVKEWAHTRGYGYGAMTNTVSNDLHLSVSGKNNIVSVILNYFF